MAITGPPKYITVPTTEYRHKLVFLCDDDRFSFDGDMMTPNELRALDLHEHENIAYRNQWLKEYTQSGIPADQDPSEY